METTSINALLIEDNPDDALLIQKYLANLPNAQYKVTHISLLTDGFKY
jgi:hypothetical protein